MPTPRVYRVDHGSIMEPWYLTSERDISEPEFRRIRSDAFVEANRRLREWHGDYTVLRDGDIRAVALEILTEEYGFKKAELVR